MIQLCCDVLKIAVELKTTERLLNWLTGEFAQTARIFFYVIQVFEVISLTFQSSCCVRLSHLT